MTSPGQPAGSGGTVVFANRIVSTLQTRVYYNPGVDYQLRGNGTGDFPAGTTDWTGFTAITGSGYMAAIMGAVGSSQPESALAFGSSPTTTTFRGGVNAGGFATATATLSEIPPDSLHATLEVFAWDDRGGTLTDPASALTLFQSGQLIGGLSGVFNVDNIGGVVNPPPDLLGLQSFNIYLIPEPSGLALFGLAGVAGLIFRRRRAADRRHFHAKRVKLTRLPRRGAS
jgi:hypothetical protein